MRLTRADTFGGTERFQIKRRLGEGSVGVVYLAYDRERDEEVALKTLRSTDALSLFRFKQEFRALANVHHPNLVGLYELARAEEQWFFTMELVYGVDFLRHTQRSDPRAPPPPPDTLRATRAHTVDLTAPLEEPHEDPDPTDLAPGPPDERRTEEFDPHQDPDALVLEISSGALEDPSEIRSTSMINGCRADVPRLLGTLQQLVSGVMALHAAHKLHRDLKPSNVLITADDRLMILDFGLVTELDPGGFELGHRRRVCGTAGYMSPEQAQAQPLTPASDWYSVGVMLFEALTGQLPFFGPVDEVLRAKRMYAPVSPSARVNGIPPMLDRLTFELLSIDPAQRPSGEDILARLGASPPSAELLEQNEASALPSAPILGRPNTMFVGRAEQLAELNKAMRKAQAGKAIAVVITGASGLGKSMLVRHFLDGASASGAMVLAGRCYERESVPYKALDPLIDALCHHLMVEQTPAESLPAPDDCAALARLFPVLRRVEAITERCTNSQDTPDPQELRRRAFAGLRQLLSVISRKLILWIDDLQWTDQDSLLLLQAILRPPAPPLLLIGCYGGEDLSATPIFERLSESGAEVTEFRLPPLGATEAQEMAVGLLSGAESSQRTPLPANIQTAQRQASSIVLEADGNPLFISELARYARAAESSNAQALTALSLEDVIHKRLQHLRRDARDLLEILAIAGRPLAQAIVLRAAHLALGEHKAIATLRAQNLARTKGPRGDDLIELIHDRVRKAVLRAIPQAELPERHRELAVALEQLQAFDTEALAHHFKEAGEPERAAEYTVLAAKRAFIALAFDRSAQLYKEAIALHPNHPTLRKTYRRLGDALANAGRGAEAANAYLNAAKDVRRSVAIERQRLAAEQFLRSGHIEEGVSALKRVMKAVSLKLPEHQASTIAALATTRVRLALRRRRLADISNLSLAPLQPTAEDYQERREVQLKVDVLWTGALGLGMVDVLRSVELQTHNLLLSIKLGDPYRLVRAMTGEALSLATQGSRTWRRTKALTAEATKIATDLDHPHALGLVAMAAGMAQSLVGHWGAASPHYERALKLFTERCTGVAWETTTSRHMHFWALAYRGELGALAGEVPRWLQEAKQRGDLYAVAQLSTGLPNLAWLVPNTPNQARKILDDGMRRWPQHGFHLQHYNDLLARVQLDLYLGRAHDAHARLDARWSPLTRAPIYRVQQVRIEALHLRARTAIAAAGLSGDRRQAQTDIAQRCVQKLHRERVAWAEPIRALLEASLTALAGDSARAAEQFTWAGSACSRAQMRLFASAATWRAAELQRDEAALARVRAELEAQGVKAPERWLQIFIPKLPG